MNKLYSIIIDMLTKMSDSLWSSIPYSNVEFAISENENVLLETILGNDCGFWVSLTVCLLTVFSLIGHSMFTKW